MTRSRTQIQSYACECKVKGHTTTICTVQCIAPVKQVSQKAQSQFINAAADAEDFNTFCLININVKKEDTIIFAKSMA